MVGTLRGSIGVGSAALVAVLGLGATACGGGGDEAAAASTADFCVEMQQLDKGDDVGPYTAFYDKHPEPTPADWAADGHLVTEFLEASIDQIGAMHPSKEAEPLIDDVLAAFEVVKQNSIGISQAGERDDQAAIDELERVNQDTNVPALMASIEAVGGLCEASAGS